MILGYYDGNESIAYPVVVDTDTDVAGLSLSKLISAMSISMSNDVFAATLGQFYVSALTRDVSGSAVLVVSDSPSGGPRISITFRIQISGKRFTTVKATVSGNITDVATRCVAYVVISRPDLLGLLSVGQSAVFGAIPQLVPAVLKVARPGAVRSFAVVQETGPAMKPYAVVNSVTAPTTTTIDKIAEVTETPTITATGPSSNGFTGTATAPVSVPTSTPGSAATTVPSYVPMPAVIIGGVVPPPVRAVAGTAVTFLLGDWLAALDTSNPPGNFNRVDVFQDGALIGNTTSSYARAFSAAGAFSVLFAAVYVDPDDPLIEYVVATSSVNVVVGAAPGYVEIDPGSTAVANPSVGSQAGPTLVFAASSLMETAVERTVVYPPPYQLEVYLASPYEVDDATAVAAATTDFVDIVETTDLVLVAGKNLTFAFDGNEVTIAAAPGAHVTPPYVGLTVPASVACNGMLRTLFGAGPDGEGNIEIVGGAGVAIIPEPGANRITIVIVDPREQDGGKSCT